MVELLGLLLALVLLGLGLSAWRLLRRGAALLRRLAAPARPAVAERRRAWRRGRRLRVARAQARAQAARIAALTAELEASRRALRLARVAMARPGPPEPRFLRAKRAFARQFHPDRLRCAEPERGIRGAIFRQFWQELRRIERE
ncbi:hypothetical protein [Roseicella frigidaeris]|uniref:J domain-containing protein n=1 Tax=Roseicella frigidaeris TaxID=2230885 RepID=A0A327M4L0_9PROT|nr:hypothetical protein [Roseicella frigidaeris]RAI57244.1 hypothetical protein DOO78_19655 [Roseicella frigidaeris]